MTEQCGQGAYSRPRQGSHTCALYEYKASAVPLGMIVAVVLGTAHTDNIPI